ncbi:hypothetical protein G6F62_015824 [Rhizopus arrhizus]|nr:hypothetical protein G6F62_015824 [Rhizopus arrhizus]
MPSARRMRSTSASSMVMPSTRVMRARRSAMVAGCGRSASRTASVTAAGVPPARSSTSRLADSLAVSSSA